jgi:hypothetical protein
MMTATEGMLNAVAAVIDAVDHNDAELVHKVVVAGGPSAKAFHDEAQLFQKWADDAAKRITEFRGSLTQ